jgi:uncharacterized membrane protein
MTKEQSAAEQPIRTIEWKLVLTVAVLAGVIAGGLSAFGKQFYNWVVPGGMMVASWVAVNRAAGHRFWAGFTASLLTGVLGWGIYLIWNYRSLVQGGRTISQAIVLSLAFLVPLILIVSLFGSWVFSRTRERVLAAQKRALEEKEKQKELYRKRPKRKYKKKK